MTEVATTTTPQKSSRAQLGEFAKALKIIDWQTRVGEGGTIVAVAGTRGLVRPVDGGLLVTLRVPSAALVTKMIGLGLVEVSSAGDLLVSRMPEPSEMSIWRELLGLHRHGAA
jgi:hypothetical protein